MSKKSAASVKPVNKSVSEERTPEEYFAEGKAGLIAIAKSYERNAMRIDKVLQEMMFLKDSGIIAAHEETAVLLCITKRNTYSELVRRLEKLEFEDMEKDDDPFIDLICYVEVGQTPDVKQMFVDHAIFDAARPIGEKVEQLKITIRQLQEKSKC